MGNSVGRTSPKGRWQRRVYESRCERASLASVIYMPPPWNVANLGCNRLIRQFVLAHYIEYTLLNNN